LKYQLQNLKRNHSQADHQSEVDALLAENVAFFVPSSIVETTFFACRGDAMEVLLGSFRKT